MCTNSFNLLIFLQMNSHWQHENQILLVYLVASSAINPLVCYWKAEITPLKSQKKLNSCWVDLFPDRSEIIHFKVTSWIVTSFGVFFLLRQDKRWWTERDREDIQTAQIEKQIQGNGRLPEETKAKYDNAKILNKWIYFQDKGCWVLFTQNLTKTSK